jgi:hypothetical protein
MPIQNALLLILFIFKLDNFTYNFNKYLLLNKVWNCIFNDFETKAKNNELKREFIAERIYELHARTNNKIERVHTIFLVII